MTAGEVGGGGERERERGRVELKSDKGKRGRWIKYIIIFAKNCQTRGKRVYNAEETIFFCEIF